MQVLKLSSQKAPSEILTASQCTVVYTLMKEDRMRPSRDYRTAPKPWFLIPFSSKSYQSFLQEYLVLALGHEIYKVYLDHLVNTRTA